MSLLITEGGDIRRFPSTPVGHPGELSRITSIHAVAERSRDTHAMLPPKVQWQMQQVPHQTSIHASYLFTFSTLLSSYTSPLAFGAGWMWGNCPLTSSSSSLAQTGPTGWYSTGTGFHVSKGVSGYSLARPRSLSENALCGFQYLASVSQPEARTFW